MPVISGVDLEAMRNAIGNLFDPIPELKKVARYADAKDQLDVPGAELYLLNIRREPQEEQLGYNAYTAQWRINVHLAPPGAGAQRAAQQLYELLVMRFHLAFDPLILIRAIPIITTCSFDGADFKAHPTSDGTLFAVFMCSVTFLARQPS